MWILFYSSRQQTDFQISRESYLNILYITRWSVLKYWRKSFTMWDCRLRFYSLYCTTVLICEFDTSPSVSWTAGSYSHINLIRTEYSTQIFCEPTKSVINSVLLARLRTVPPNDLTSSALLWFPVEGGRNQSCAGQKLWNCVLQFTLVSAADDIHIYRYYFCYRDYYYYYYYNKL